MALRTVSNTGGNWSATTAWVGGVVPVGGDTVNFTATSGNLTVNVSTAALGGIDFSSYVNTITFTNNITSAGTINLGTGGYTQAGSAGLVINNAGTGQLTTTISGSTIWSRTLSFTGTSNTHTLGSNLTVTGAITMSGATSATFTGNTLDIGGSLTVSNTVTISGTTTFNFNGTGTWNHTAAGVIRNNVTINTLGTLTIGTNIYYNTGTLTYTAGTVVTTGSTLNCTLSTIFNCSNMDGVTTNKWNNITLSGTSQTFTLSSNLNVDGTLSLSGTTASTFTGNTLNIGGSLTVTTTATVSGTTAFNFNGTGTWNHTTTGVIRNNVTINTSGTLTIGTNIYYNTGTLTYTAGTVTTTGSTLNISAPTTLDTDRGATQIDWNNVITSSTTTITLLSNLNITNLTVSASSVLSFVSGGNMLSVSNNLTTAIQATFNTPNNLQVTNLILGIGGNGNININGLFTISVSGNLTQNHGTLLATGTTNIILNGTGTWSNASTGPMRFNLTIDTLGTLTISGNVYYTTGTLTYTAGTINTAGSTLNTAAATTFNTNIMLWDSIIFTGGQIQTLTSDLNLSGNLTSTSTTINGLFNVNIGGNLRNVGIGTTSGTATLVLNGTGTLSTDSNAGGIQNNLIINTKGTITFGNIISYNTRTLTYITGKIITKNNTFYLTLSSTLINCHKINFNNVIISSGQTITMNEFFSGSPSLVTNIGSNSLTTNYTITFQDNFEKITKFVNVSGCTLSKPLQLLVLTRSKRNSTNRGIRYINQSPNGIAKGDPSIQNQTTFGASGLLSDPNMR